MSLGSYKMERLNFDKVIIVLEVIFLIVIVTLHAFRAGHYVDFYPINGTFQNFNPVRRLLAGQIPCKDFNDYLALGHLYIGALTTCVFGKTYKDSLVAFSFLSFVSFALLALIIGKAIFKEWRINLALTNLLLVLLLLKPFFFVNGIVSIQEVLNALNYALDTGNSARYVRGGILPVTVAIFLLLVNLYNKKCNLSRKQLSIMAPLLMGIIAGFALGWSSDYGISCWLCILLMVFWISFSRNRNLLLAARSFFITLISSLFSIFIFVEVFSLGHFKNWLRFSFGTGGYQSWYYNSVKSFYLYDVDFSFLMMIQASLTIVYLIKIFINRATKDSTMKYGVLAFANMTCFCTVNEYQLLAGGGCKEVAISTLFITIFYELINIFLVNINDSRINKLLVASIIICLAWIIPSAKDEILFKFAEQKEGQYIEQMGGYMTSLNEDIQDAHVFLAGNRFFSTYASGQEVYENTFQPTGIDYIIHVLGDEQRESYLEQFINGDFRYAVTIKKTFTDWEYWVERANWFFYRELYANWHPVYSNTYETFWERNTSEISNVLADDFEVKTEYIDDSEIRLTLDIGENVNGIADIYIDYNVDKIPCSKLAALQFQRMLYVQNIAIHANDAYYESNYLRPVSTEYIPMTIENGHGELILTSLPNETTLLNLNEVRCNKIYTVDDTIIYE